MTKQILILSCLFSILTVSVKSLAVGYDDERFEGIGGGKFLMTLKIGNCEGRFTGTSRDLEDFANQVPNSAIERFQDQFNQEARERKCLPQNL